MAVVRVAGVEHEKVLAAAYGLAHSRVELPCGRVVEDELELGVLFDLNLAIGRANALLEVLAAAEGVIFEAGAGERCAGADRGVEAGFHHRRGSYPPSHGRRVLPHAGSGH